MFIDLIQSWNDVEVYMNKSKPKGASAYSPTSKASAAEKPSIHECMGRLPQALYYCYVCGVCLVQQMIQLLRPDQAKALGRFHILDLKG